jgi:YjbE family integral membrane protein
MDFSVFIDLAKIIGFNILLSGDNAVVIGLAANRLPEKNRRRAILLGGVGAVVLRIFFTVAVAVLLDVPFLRAGGAILLIWISYQLADQHAEETRVNAADTLKQAVRTIILADAIMSLDNMLAVAAAAQDDKHEKVLLLFGLAISIPIVLFGSDMLSRLLGRYPLLTWVGIFILVYTAVHMGMDDPKVDDSIGHISEAPVWVLAITITGVIFLVHRKRASTPDPLLS